MHKPAKIAFVGDVLFRGSIGRTDFPRGNHADLIRSIRTRLFPLGDDVRFALVHRDREAAAKVSPLSTPIETPEPKAPAKKPASPAPKAGNPGTPISVGTPSATK